MIVDLRTLGFDQFYKRPVGGVGANSVTYSFSSGSYNSGISEANSGLIGGWNIQNGSLTSGLGTNRVGVDSGGVNPAFYAGPDETSDDMTTSKFRVSAAGALNATGATVSGAITATSGTIGGWNISASSLISPVISGNYITIDTTRGMVFHDSPSTEVGAIDFGGGLVRVYTNDIFAMGQVRLEHSNQILIRSIAGAPTASLVNNEMVLDTTNSRIWFNVLGTWKYAALT
jgi:hypothetical protein